MDQTNITVLNLNVKSLRAHFNELLIFLNNSSTHYDCIVLTETWVFGSELFKYDIPGYMLFAQCRESNRSGGVLIYVKNYFKAEQIKIGVNSDTCNVIGINLNTRGNKSVSLFGIYKFCDSAYSKFLDELSYIIKVSQKTSIIAGDFNINLLDDAKCADYLNLLYTHGFISLINKPTFFRQNSKYSSCLDHIFVRDFECNKLREEINCNIFYVGFSDHHAASILVVMKEHIAVKPNTFQTIIDKNLFHKKLTNTKLDLLYNTQLSVDSKFKYLVDIVMAILQKCRRRKKLNKHKKRNPWITNEIIELSCNKISLYKPMKVANKDKFLLSQYKNISKQIQKLSRIAKKEYYSNMLNECGADQNKYWRVVKKIIGSRNYSVREIKIDNKLLVVEENKHEVACCLISTFYIR